MNTENEMARTGSAPYRDDVVRMAREIDAAIALAKPADGVCDMLRSADCKPREIFAEMIRAWRIFAPDFRASCSEENRRYLYDLTDEVPCIIHDNYLQQVRGLKRVDARRRASTMRGRVNISLDAPFSDGARYEVHDIFSRKDTAEGWARSLAMLPNLGANDIANTIWTGRIYQDDFFRLAPQRLKMKMLEHLHAVDATIVRPFAAQIIEDRSLPRHYRVVTWAEGVLRAHDYLGQANAIVRRAYQASYDERSRNDRERGVGRPDPDVNYTSRDVLDWVASYSGGDNPARFDMERVLRGFKLSRQIINWLILASGQKVLTHYITEHTDELSEFYPLGELAAKVCSCSGCKCVVPLLRCIEERAPGTLAGYLDFNGANLLEYLLYRYAGKEPKRGSWLQMCFDRASGIREFADFLLGAGCDGDAPNGVGFTWRDMYEASKLRFDESVFSGVVAEDLDDCEHRAGIDDLFKATAPYRDVIDFEEYLLNDQQD